MSFEGGTGCKVGDCPPGRRYCNHAAWQFKIRIDAVQVDLRPKKAPWLSVAGCGASSFFPFSPSSRFLFFCFFSSSLVLPSFLSFLSPSSLLPLSFRSPSSLLPLSFLSFCLRGAGPGGPGAPGLAATAAVPSPPGLSDVKINCLLLFPILQILFEWFRKRD